MNDRKGNPLIVGDRVRHAFRDAAFVGTVQSIEEGCNALAWIQFDGHEFMSVLPSQDIEKV